MAEALSRINFQLPIPLKREIAQAAKENRRSMGGEVLFRLQQAIQAEHRAKRASKRSRKSATAARPASAVLHP
jgi:hypothetical protein